METWSDAGPRDTLHHDQPRNERVDCLIVHAGSGWLSDDATRFLHPGLSMELPKVAPHKVEAPELDKQDFRLALCKIY